MSIVSVELDVLWTIQRAERPVGEWYLYVNYRPRLDQRLADALYGASEPALKLSDFRQQCRDAEIIVAEATGILPPITEPTIGSVRMPLAVRDLSFNHTIRWADGPPRFDPEVLNWHRDLLMGTGQYHDRTDGSVAMGTLSTATQSAIRRLDGFVIDTAYNRFECRVAAAAALPANVVLIPAKTPVFISYRRSQLGVAKALHRMLGGYGNSRLFEPYLDEHQIELGSLRQQLRERIEASMLFMPIVSADYALPGTLSEQELAGRARSLKRGVRRILLHRCTWAIRRARWHRN